MTRSRWAVLWVFLLLFTGCLAYVMREDLDGGLVGNLMLLYGFAAFVHWTESTFQKWRRSAAQE